MIIILNYSLKSEQSINKSIILHCILKNYNDDTNNIRKEYDNRHRKCNL